MLKNIKKFNSMISERNTLDNVITKICKHKLSCKNIKSNYLYEWTISLVNFLTKIYVTLFNN